MSHNDANSKLRLMIDEAFRGSIETPPKSRFYKIAVLLTLFTIILLPIIYFLIVGLIGYGLYDYNHLIRDFYQAYSNVDLNQEIWVSNPISWFLYIPLVIGGVIEIFLLRVLLPRKRKKDIPLHIINPQNESLLCFLIERICLSINSPIPKRIELVMEPEISVGFQRNTFRFFRGDITLTIGLPLFSELTIRELAGTLAHELGNSRRKGIMHLTHLNSLIRDWLYRGVHDDDIEEEPDLSDLRIDVVYSGRYGVMGWKWLWLMIVFFAQFFVLLVRGILWLFLMWESVVGSFLSRQMKYDSDRLQIHVAGSRDFEATLYAMAILKRAFEKTSSMTHLSWKKHVLVNNLPMLVKEQAKDIIATQKQKNDEIDSLLAQEPKLLDMKPPLRDRIAKARQNNLPGICNININSRILLNDFDLLCRKLTRIFYEKKLKTNRDENKRYLNVDEYQDFILENKPIIRIKR